MKHLPTHPGDMPVRLFRSDFLEFFTHISPVTVVVLWLPVATFFFARPILKAGRLEWVVLVGFLLGLFLWTLLEYLLHRFLFHFPARGAFQERISFLFHGVHHAQPQCKTRLVMPPAVSIPLAIGVYALLYLLVGVLLRLPGWVDPLTSGLLVGYLTYDLTHYATHHFPMRNGYAKFLKRYHMQHHYKTPNQRFGVSSPLWDWVFGTLPAEK